MPKKQDFNGATALDKRKRFYKMKRGKIMKTKRTLGTGLFILIVFVIATAAMGHSIQFLGRNYFPGPPEYTRFTYKVTSGEKPALSHWVLQFCGKASDIKNASHSYQFGYDKTTGITGIKFEGIDWDKVKVRTFWIELYGNWPSGSIKAGFKAGKDDIQKLNTTGPVCNGGPTSAIHIEKHTNGKDADNPTGPNIPVGGEVIWTYYVTNPGEVPISNVVVTDDQGVTPIYKSGDKNGDGKLDTDEEWIYEAKGVAVEGQYENTATVTGKDPDNKTVSDTDPSHYIAEIVELCSLGDFVWNDVNGNGIQDGTEIGIGSVDVKLYQEGKVGVFKSTTTNTNGIYSFTDLLPGNYYIRFIPPTGYTCSPQNKGGDDTVDSDPDSITGLTEVITLDPGENDLTWDAGMFEYASISDYVWEDKNKNGIQDDGTEGIGNILVFLFKDLDGDGIPEPKGLRHRFSKISLPNDASGANIFATSGDDGYSIDSTVTTWPNGYYIFNYLFPGPYFLIFKLPLGYVFTLQGTTTDDKDSDVNRRTGITEVTYLDPGENDITWDAGVYRANGHPGKGRRWILARYQPWYGDAENDSTLRHWDFNYLGGQADTSLFDFYDSYDPNIWEYHILLAWACGIDGFAADWYGKNSYENPGMKGLLDKADSLYILYHDKGFNFEIAVSYNEKAYGRLDTNFIYIGDTLMIHPAYWGTRRHVYRPVFIYNLEDTLITAAEYRACADTTLPSNFILLWNGTEIEVFDPMDVCYPWVRPPIGEWIPGIALWDPAGLEWGENYLDSTYWRMNYLPHIGDLKFTVGGVWPGFNDKFYSKGLNHWMSRQDTLVYELTWEKVHNYYYALPMPWVYIETWNDFNQATEIEPSLEWDYKFNVLTRDHARRFKGSLPPDSVGVENLGLLVPQHVLQARIAAILRANEADDIVKLLDKALDYFFDREHLKALSIADSAAGIAPRPLSIDAIGDSSVQISWGSARHANSYNIYYSSDESCFEPCAFRKPNIISAGNVNQYTVTGLEPGTWYTIAVTAVDTSLGPYANESWYENTYTGAKTKKFKTTGVSDVSSIDKMIPEESALSQNYPNPFNPGTTIQYQLHEPGRVQLTIYNLMGQEVRTLVNENKKAGYYQMWWDAKDNFGESVSNGIYVYQLVVNSKRENFVLVKKMIVLQ